MMTAVTTTKKITLYSLLALIALYASGELAAERLNWTVLLVSCGSLVIFLPGVIKNQPRAYDWLCFLILTHFIKGTTDSMTPTATWQDYLQVFFSVSVFIAAMMTSRWIKASQNQAPAHESP